MTPTLRMAPDLVLPIDSVTQRKAFLGKPGSGKSYAATKEAELMYDAGAQFVAIDPVGIWYGLRLDGKGKGLPIPVFGGLHGDVPLEPTSGKMMADLIVDRRLTCVLDVSQFEHDTDKARFAAGFAARFFFRMKAAPSAVHLFLEECQEFIPQEVPRGEQQMVHDFVRMTKLGRNFGIGISLITQRPQEVNKKALNLTECLFAFQMTGKHERQAIKEWVQTVGADENILSILPTLPVASAHVYSPQWLRISKTVKIGEKRTADVSSTPAVGISAAQTQPLRKIDLELIRTEMASTIENAKANDPAELRKTITDLRRQLVTKPSAAPATKVDVRAQINDAVERAAAGFQKEESRRMRLISTEVRKTASLLDGASARLRDVADQIEKAPPAIHPISIRPPVARAILSAPKEVASTSPLETPLDPSGIGGGPQRILNAMLFLETIGTSPAPRPAIAGLIGMAWDTGTFRTYISRLRSAGLITNGNGLNVALTKSGRSLASHDGLPTTREQLHTTWISKLGSTEGRMLRTIIDAYPDALSREEIGRAAGIEPDSGTFRTYLSRLRSPGLITDEGMSIRASDALFPEGLR